MLSWRLQVADGEFEEGSRIAAAANMTAGQMFSSEDEEDLIDRQLQEEGQMEQQESKMLAQKK